MPIPCDLVDMKALGAAGGRWQRESAQAGHSPANLCKSAASVQRRRALAEGMLVRAGTLLRTSLFRLAAVLAAVPMADCAPRHFRAAWCSAWSAIAAAPGMIGPLGAG